MNIKRAILITATALGFSSAALADGFSATLDMPIIPTSNFSIGLGLNYSLQVIENLYVGASLNPTITPGAANVFSLGARVGAKYVVVLFKDNASLVNGYVGAGVEATVVPAFSIGADVNAGVYGITGIGGGFKLYGGLDAEAGYNFTASLFVYDISTKVGVFVEPITNLEFRVEGLVGINNGGFNWGVGSSLYYTIIPQFKVGMSAGYGSGGAFVFGIGALFAEKPGTLGIAGNYLP
jgi:hypothetical protein